MRCPLYNFAEVHYMSNLILLRGSIPSRADQIDWLFNQGVRAIVSLEQLSSQALVKIKELGIAHISLPIDDFGIPADEQITRFIAFVDQHRACGNLCYVHCSAGIGRSGTMTAIYLVHLGESALSVFQRIRLESWRQKDLLFDFAAKLKVANE